MIVKPSDRLRDVPEVQVGLALPAPLSARLDVLLELARDAGENTSRKELAAALLLAAPIDGAELVELIRTYRLASVEEAVVDGQPVRKFVDPVRTPGPRPR